MRILGVGETNDLGDMYLRLMAAGHEVRVFMGDEHSHDVMQGMIDFVPEWRGSLEWIREAGDEGIIVFETATLGDEQDSLRADGYNVVGGSAVGDRLENDRKFGQEILAGHGMQTAFSREFSSFDEGIAFIRAEPRRYVFKLNGANWLSARNYVGQMDDGRDVIALLTAARDRWSAEESASFLLMEFIDGVEVGVGAFFNGRKFLEPANLDWEHKRFFPGDIGELTGEMGTVVTYRGARRMFEATLSRLAPILEESGYCGYINLNTIVNEKGIWPLELTSRFGYPGFAILDSLHDDDWGTILYGLTRRNIDSIRTKDGFSVGVVLTVPPFPYSDGYDELGRRTPICFRETLTDEDRDSLHYGEVTMQDGELRTAGMIGYALVVTGIGATIEKARADAYDRVHKVVIPNGRYRQDIGVKLMEKDWARLNALGWIG
ncbi:MAG TPA: phosphoribosylglycinamide synthetase C domain-containing protein [Gemmatimonadaceae bacterium]|nr:phosphoribosylglycinamide synthetase C domain-containing protein [Gemmatimonadaceae bacterium]